MYVFVCACVCLHVCLYVHDCMWLCVCVYLCVRLCVCVLVDGGKGYGEDGAPYSHENMACVCMYSEIRCNPGGD